VTDYTRVRVTVDQTGTQTGAQTGARQIHVTIGNNRDTLVPEQFIQQVCQMNGTEITLDDLVVGEEYMMEIYGPLVQANGMGMVYRPPVATRPVAPDTVNLLIIWYKGDRPPVILRVVKPFDMEVDNLDPSQAVSISQVVFTGQGRDINYYGKRSETTIARVIREDVSIDDMEFRGHYVITFPRAYVVELLGENFNENNL